MARRKTLTPPVSSSQRMMRLLGMSLHNRHRASPNQTGPSAHRMPVAMRSTFASASRYLPNDGSTILTRGSGYRWLGSHCCATSVRDVANTDAAPPAARNALRFMVVADGDDDELAMG